MRRQSTHTASRRAVLVGTAAVAATAGAIAAPALASAGNDALIEALLARYKVAWDEWCEATDAGQIPDDAPNPAYAIEDEILAMPAAGPRGLWVKIQLLHDRLGGVIEGKPHSAGGHEVMLSLAADIRRLAGAS